MLYKKQREDSYMKTQKTVKTYESNTFWEENEGKMN